MENLTVANKNFSYMFKTGIITSMLFISCGLHNFAKTQVKGYEVVLQIDFQDFFELDTMSMSIDNFTVFKDIVVNSGTVLGLTDVQVQLKKQKDYFICSFRETTNKCPDIGKFVKIKVLVNGVKSEYNIDIGKGKFIGFSKKSNNKLLFVQANSPFEYD